MQDTTKEFLTKLATLMEEYNAEFEITESCRGYGGFSADGLGIGVPHIVQVDDCSYKKTEHVELSGRFHSFLDIREIVGSDK